MWLFSYCASCNLAIPFPVDCSVQFPPFSNNEHNNFQFLSAYWCKLLIHLDNVHFGNRLVTNAWWQCFLWKICRLSKLEIDFGILFLYARLKNRRIMPWQCPSVRPSVRPGFPDFSSTCFQISIWNLVYTFSRWHNISSLSCITIESLWPSLQPKVGQTHFLQSWPHKSR